MNPGPQSVLEQVLADLTAEGDALEAAVAPLDERGWRTPVPAAGWDPRSTVLRGLASLRCWSFAGSP